MSQTNNVAQVAFDAATGVATITLEMEGRANKINRDFGEGLGQAIEETLALEGLKGVILTSGHKDFCVGGDIDAIFTARDAGEVVEGCRRLNGLFRRLETSGKPVVAALNGSALGGGYEIALACHHRIAIDNPKLMVGLPEVTLGLLPGAGGTQRLPRVIGLQGALEYILEGKMVRAPKAHKAGLVDALAPDVATMHQMAAAWIAENPGAKQPWDAKGFRYKGAQPDSQDAKGMFIVACAMLEKKTAGAFPAPRLAMAAVQEGAAMGFEAGLEIEGRYFAELVVSDTAKNMMRIMWYHRTAAERFEGLNVADDHGFQTIGILGAGMMGAGLAWVSASRGFKIIVRDISQEALDRGQAHCAEQAKRIARYKGAEAAQAILDTITWTLEVADLAPSDLIIEAVFEDDELKARVTREVEAVLRPDCIFASNTSGIPINHLAKASRDTSRFIGLHFFSPVEKMPLLEIICGDDTSDETLARCLAYTKAIGKLPIVVGDGYGFYTSRTFGAYLSEAVQMVAEGHDPVLIEYAARKAGMIVPPLKVFDEVSLKLGHHGMTQAKKFKPEVADMEGIALLEKLVTEHERLGKAHGAGFYDYQSKPRRIWSGLKELVTGTPAETGVDYIADRLMLAQVNQVAWCLEEGIIKRHRDAEVGAIFGIGFAPASGGPLSWIDQRGAREVVVQLQALAETCGPRFAPPPSLVEHAERGERFFPKV